MTEVYHVLKGEGVLWLDGQPVSVGPDTVIEIAPGVAHKLENGGVGPLVHLVTCVPAFDPNDVILLEDSTDEATDRAPPG